MYALKILKRMQACRPSGDGDPVAALQTGTALFAVLRLDELAKLNLAEKCRIAPMPGSTFTFDYATGEKIATKAGTVNRMPYIGWGSWLGGVTKSCRNPQAAWDFLADFGGPSAGLELIAAARWGAGPFRRSHEDTRYQTRWLGYGLDKPNTDQLLNALRTQNGSSIVNYRLALRLPNGPAHERILAEELKAVLSGGKESESALNAVKTRWIELDRATPASLRQEWIRHSLGL